MFLGMKGNILQDGGRFVRQVAILKCREDLQQVQINHVKMVGGSGM